MNKHYDLIAIGAGSGGLSVANKAARYGRAAQWLSLTSSAALVLTGVCSKENHVVRRQHRAYVG